MLGTALLKMHTRRDYECFELLRVSARTRYV